jgi:hypothetical protein
LLFLASDKRDRADKSAARFDDVLSASIGCALHLCTCVVDWCMSVRFLSALAEQLIEFAVRSYLDQLMSKI